MNKPTPHPASAGLTRRRFLGGSVAATLALLPHRLQGSNAEPRPITPSSPKPYRAAIIGRTGGGDYGHGYDLVFEGLENVAVDAVADADPAGLDRAAQRSKARRRYLDYREMLEQEQPELVAITPRQPDCHKAMALAGIAVAKGLFLEKPFTETLTDADDILAAAQKRNVKIMIAHNRRFTREFVQAKALLEQGLIGQVREVRIQGKQDSRVGGEDLLVLGTHDFDLIRLYFGDPLWCFGSVTAHGHDLQQTDIHRGQEPIVVGGDTIHALFAFANNIVVHWSSVKKADHWNTNFSKREKWGFEIFGTKGILAYQSGFGMAWLDSPFLAHERGTLSWAALPEPSGWTWPAHAGQPIRSLIHAIENDGEPVCSGYDGRWAVEMVAAVYESQRLGARVRFPLVQRTSPLRHF